MTQDNSQKISLAIDGNEANVSNRVGSNIYAFEVLKAIHVLTKNYYHYNSQKITLDITVFLADKAQSDLPKARKNFRYQVLSPKKLWTQWALPLHLFQNRDDFDALFSPGHYLPFFSPLPSFMSVMDLAFLEFPNHFRKKDYFQLKTWTKRSVKQAQIIFAISDFSQEELIKHYQLPPKKIKITYPDLSKKEDCSAEKKRQFLRKYNINYPYFIYVGTLQPRKNLIRLIKAFEKFLRFCAAHQKDDEKLPQLIIAGKIGWLADDIIERIKQSSFKEQFILTGYIPNAIKWHLLKKAEALVLVGLYEGFGIPALEALEQHTLPIVSDDSSLPEVVGEAGILVKPKSVRSIYYGLKKVWTMKKGDKIKYGLKASSQVNKFSWLDSGKTILDTIIESTKMNQ